MKYKYAIFAGFICLFLFASCHRFFGKNEMSPKRTMAFQMTNEIAEDLFVSDNLRFCGISESSPKGLYVNIGLLLFSKKVLTRDEGRILVLKCLDKMLKKFNGNSEFSQYIENGKFTFKDLDVNIFVQPADGSEVYYPDIRIFSFVKGNVEYDTKIPNMARYYTEEKETYEEALRLVGEACRRKRMD